MRGSVGPHRRSSASKCNAAATAATAAQTTIHYPTVFSVDVDDNVQSAK